MSLSRGYCMTYLPLSRTWKNMSNKIIHTQSIKDTTLLIRNLLPFHIQTNLRRKSGKPYNSSLSEVRENENIQVSIGEKVKQTTKDVSYLGVIIAGIGITGVVFYAIITELLSGYSPNSIYTDALKLCKSNTQVLDAIGVPIKAYGEMSSRGRRRHISHFEYEKDNVNYMRMIFYIEGSRRKGTVQLEVKKDNKGKYDYRYLFVDLEGYPKQTIILQDNRLPDVNSLKVNL